MKKSVLLLIIILLPLMAMAQGPEGEPSGEKRTPVEIDGLKYYLDEDLYEATVANNNQWTGELEIPSAVDYDGKTYSVTYISYLAFDNCKSLTKVRIPKNVKDIYHYAGFEDCKNPFIGCVNLEAIEVEEGSEYMCSENGVLFNHDMTILYSYPGGAKSTSYSIPRGVAKMGLYTFSGNASLKSVTMPNTITTGGGSTFSGCSSLEEVKLSDNLTQLYPYMFMDCTQLKTVDIPPSIKRISNEAFMGCTSLKKLNVPASVTAIGYMVFAGCSFEELVIRGILKKDGWDNYYGWDIFKGLAESSVVYVPATEVEECKKYFSGVVLPLEDDATLVKSCDMAAQCQRDSIFYDLQGRRIGGEPKAGIYIRDGRKVVVR